MRHLAWMNETQMYDYGHEHLKGYVYNSHFFVASQCPVPDHRRISQPTGILLCMVSVSPLATFVYTNRGITSFPN